MPNWCLNTVRLTNPDPNLITRAQKAFEAGEFLNEFVPMPKDLKETMAGREMDPDARRELEIQEAYNVKNYGYKNWWDFAVNEWGTKWDVGQDHCQRVNDNTLVLSFESAWAPPVPFYDKLDDYDFDVDATYFEPGMGFCGRFTTLEGDDYYEIEETTADWVTENIPREIDEAMGISDTYQEMEDL